MTRTLCFDFGNSRLKAAVFDEDKIIDEFVLMDDSPTTLLPYLDKYTPQRSILSSVVDHDTALETLLAERTAFHKLSHLTSLPFTTPVGKPETIGADRLALAAAAVQFHPG